jgi:hypothetical protein
VIFRSFKNVLLTDMRQTCVVCAAISDSLSRSVPQGPKATECGAKRVVPFEDY